MGEHDINVDPRPHVGSVPFVFGAFCSCGWRYGPNAFKWTALAMQGRHYSEVGLTNGRGLLAAEPEEATDGR